MKKTFIALSISAICFLSGSAQALKNSDCFTCHVEVDKALFEKSIHGKNQCTSCHADISAVPHEKKPAPVKCARCHRLEQQVYANSDHGKAVAKGIPEAASCKACHGDNHYLQSSRDQESPVFRGNISETCGKCHNDSEKMAQYRLSEREPYKSYQGSIHGMSVKAGEIYAAVCSDCHGSHDIHSSSNPESGVYKFNIPATCGKCHGNVLQTYKMSVHAKAFMAGIKDAPVCTDCHDEHTIQSHSDPASSVAPQSIVKTCSKCHASEKITLKYGLPTDVLPLYLGSYHGTAYQYGSATVANCASCHGFHDVLASSDPRSSINPANIQATCGKCHSGAGELLHKGSVHVRPSVNSDKVIFYVSLFYIIMIIGTIGGMLGHNLLDFGKKLKGHYKKCRAEGVAMRLTKAERIGHIILLSSFIILVYTGFAHKYPNAFYSYPFTIENIGPLIRKILHRAAGIVFIGFMCYHAWFMLGTERGRKKLLALLPRWQDFWDAVQLVKYNLGLVKTRPLFDRFNYMEKAEYWALIWGSAVMIVTGLILMFEGLSLHFLPKWLIDVMLVIHFFEALLATLAILVWHFYWVIFDPHVYPMNWTWLTGKVTKEQLEERKDDAEV